jgi:hypothetical protein
MNQRRFRNAAAAIVTISIMAVAGWWVWDQLRQMGLSVGCRSDSLSTVAHHLREYAEQHEGRLPPPAETLAVAGGEHGHYLFCQEMELPYQWNLQVLGAQLDEPERRPLAWCPPGGHGRWVGVILIGEGDLHVEQMTIAELREALKRDLAGGGKP